jgi:hypothetical protein
MLTNVSGLFCRSEQQVNVATNSNGSVAGGAQAAELPSISFERLQLLDGVGVRLESSVKFNEPRLKFTQKLTTPCDFREERGVLQLLDAPRLATKQGFERATPGAVAFVRVDQELGVGQLGRPVGVTRSHPI